MPFIQRLCANFLFPIVYVSHALDEILNLASGMILLDSGKVAAAGSIEELMSRTDIQHLVNPHDHMTIINTRVESHGHQSGLTRLIAKSSIIKKPSHDYYSSVG